MVQQLRKSVCAFSYIYIYIYVYIYIWEPVFSFQAFTKRNESQSSQINFYKSGL